MPLFLEEDSPDRSWLPAAKDRINTADDLDTLDRISGEIRAAHVGDPGMSEIEETITRMRGRP